MVYYDEKHKPLARHLRKKQTAAEYYLWFCLRKKQVLGVQFYRQRPIGKYIVDFYAPTAKLVVEIDGIQHYEDGHQQSDETRDQYLKHIGLDVLRFNNLEVLNNREGVINIIEKKIQGKPINIEHGKLIKLW